MAEKTELPLGRLLDWAQIHRGRFYDWNRRYGKANERNGQIPRDHWIESRERDAIIEYYDQHPLDGYRRLTFMMLDADVVAVSPSTTYRVLREAKRLDRWNKKPSKKQTKPISSHAASFQACMPLFAIVYKSTNNMGATAGSSFTGRSGNR